MMTTSTFEQQVAEVFDPKQNAVIGAVDRLLRLALHQSVELKREEDFFWVRAVGMDDIPAIKILIRPAVLRAMMARVAVLRSEQSEAVEFDPWENDGELVVDGEPDNKVHVSFINTSQAQCLRLSPISQSTS